MWPSTHIYTAGERATCIEITCNYLTTLYDGNDVGKTTTAATCTALDGCFAIEVSSNSYTCVTAAPSADSVIAGIVIACVFVALLIVAFIVVLTTIKNKGSSSSN